MSDSEELKQIIHILKQVVKNQESMNQRFEDLINLFKKYEVEEVMYSEELREG